MDCPNLETIFCASRLFNSVMNVLAQHTKLLPGSGAEIGLLCGVVLERVEDLEHQTVDGVLDTVAGHGDAGLFEYGDDLTKVGILAPHPDRPLQAAVIDQPRVYGDRRPD